MQETRFDALTRRLGAATSRRALLKQAGAALLGAVAAGVLPRPGGSRAEFGCPPGMVPTDNPAQPCVPRGLGSTPPSFSDQPGGSGPGMPPTANFSDMPRRTVAGVCLDTGIICPPGSACSSDNLTCCPAGKAGFPCGGSSAVAADCCQPGVEECCTSGIPTQCCPTGGCCADEHNFSYCCPPGTRCTRCAGTHTRCCPPGQTCVSDECCDQGQVCFQGLTCCPPGQTCSTDDLGCCPPGKTGNYCSYTKDCCAPDEHCTGDGCCATAGCGTFPGRCCGPGTICQDGECVCATSAGCTGQACCVNGMCLGQGQPCSPSFTCCPFQCVNLDNDPQNCGSCYHKCNPGQSCVAGMCQGGGTTCNTAADCPSTCTCTGGGGPPVLCGCMFAGCTPPDVFTCFNNKCCLSESLGQCCS